MVGSILFKYLFSQYISSFSASRLPPCPTVSNCQQPSPVHGEVPTHKSSAKSAAAGCNPTHSVWNTSLQSCIHTHRTNASHKRQETNLFPRLRQKSTVFTVGVLYEIQVCTFFHLLPNLDFFTKSVASGVQSEEMNSSFSRHFFVACWLFRKVTRLFLVP